MLLAVLVLDRHGHAEAHDVAVGLGHRQLGILAPRMSSSAGRATSARCARGLASASAFASSSRSSATASSIASRPSGVTRLRCGLTGRSPMSAIAFSLSSSRVKALLIVGSLGPPDGVTQGKRWSRPIILTGTISCDVGHEAEGPVPMLNRRGFLAATAGFRASAAWRCPDSAARSRPRPASSSPPCAARSTRPISACGPARFDDQSKAFAQDAAAASDRDMPLFLPRRHLCRVQPGAAALRAAVRRARRTRIVYGGDGHLMIGGGRRAHRTDRAGRSTAPIAGSATTRKASSTFAASNMPSSTIARSSAAARTASRSNASAAASERSTISGAADAGIYSVEASGLQITGNTRLRLRQWRHPGASLAGRPTTAPS